MVVRVARVVEDLVPAAGEDIAVVVGVLAVAEALGSISRPWNVVGQNNRHPFSERHGASV